MPNIDCVIFADPKQSTVDIVQAVGRALRPFKGKEYGYVIVPVISRGESADEFVDSPAFAQILTLVSSLATNDERIIDEFRAIAAGKRSTGRIVELDIDEKITARIALKVFEAEITLKIWGRLARLLWQPYDTANKVTDQRVKWLPYNEAIKFVHTLKLKSSREWKKYSRGVYLELPAKPLASPSET